MVRDRQKRHEKASRPADSRRLRVFHAAIAVILVACVICPFIELAIGWNDTIFTTGYDGESTLAILVLVLELASRLPACWCRFFQPRNSSNELLRSSDFKRASFVFV